MNACKGHWLWAIGYRFLGIGLGLLVVQGVAAQGLSGVEKLTARERDKVAAILGQQQRNFAEQCTTIKLLKAEAVSVLEPLTVDKQDKPLSGKWNVRYSVDACGKIAMRMAGFSVVPGGVAIDPLAPGETLADAKLQADVLKSFAMAGEVAMPQCRDDVTLRNTVVQVRPAKPTDRWVELWVGNFCGRDMAQSVEFMPTKKGTTFKMSLPTQSAQ